MIAQYIAKAREKSGFDKLEARERQVILIGLAFLFCFFVLQFIIGPYFEAKEKVENSIKKSESNLVELKMLQQEYGKLQEEAGGIKEQLKQRDPNFSLFSFLDTQATQANIKEYISYMKPSTSEGEGDLLESLVEMKLENIALKQLVDYLKMVESTENVVAVKRISIQEGDQEGGVLEVVLQIVTFMENG